MCDHQPGILSTSGAGVDFERIALERFGLHATSRRLPGEVDEIAELTVSGGRRYVMKASPPGTGRGVLDLQAVVLERLALLRDISAPSLVPAVDGSTSVELDDGRSVRLLTWVAGRSFAEAGRPPGAAASIGRVAGEIVQLLEGIESPSAERVLVWDLLRTVETIRRYGDTVSHPMRRQIVNEVAGRLAHHDLHGLRRQVIHNDLNDENLFVDGDQVTGVIDVGDAIETIRIGEAAIAATYAMLDQDDPVSVGGDVLRSFAEVVPVHREEALVVFDLIMARLATSVVLAAHRGDPNPHHVATDPFAGDLMERLAAADRSAIGAKLAAAAGHPTPAPEVRL